MGKSKERLRAFPTFYYQYVTNITLVYWLDSLSPLTFHHFCTFSSALFLSIIFWSFMESILDLNSDFTKLLKFKKLKSINKKERILNFLPYQFFLFFSVCLNLTARKNKAPGWAGRKVVIMNLELNITKITRWTVCYNHPRETWSGCELCASLF